MGWKTHFHAPLYILVQSSTSIHKKAATNRKQEEKNKKNSQPKTPSSCKVPTPQIVMVHKAAQTNSIFGFKGRRVGHDGKFWESLTSHIAQVMGLTWLHIPI
eukprot:TRINITY_DN7615_c3_g1_i1.p1 TRINITY_DN7615_c3_g1~~TRINITY_DN7615_c3_g1_i1.p1  ORF type:complete len:102 (-),score=17.52 TRINITY_DN7615_c3_g1_i1:81-386(-)